MSILLVPVVVSCQAMFVFNIDYKHRIGSFTQIMEGMFLEGMPGAIRLTACVSTYHLIVLYVCIIYMNVSFL